jgi:hypothetical protein
MSIDRLLLYAFLLWLVARDLASEPFEDRDDEDDDE